jgi:hypothetical protein
VATDLCPNEGGGVKRCVNGCFFASKVASVWQRNLRVKYPGDEYHVMSRGDRRAPIFRDDEDRQKFITALRRLRALHA